MSRTPLKKGEPVSTKEVKPYFHEATQQEREQYKTYTELREHFRQPDWCRLHEALDGWGCWSLAFYPERISNEFCSSCDYHKNNKDE